MSHGYAWVRVGAGGRAGGHLMLEYQKSASARPAAGSMGCRLTKNCYAFSEGSGLSWHQRRHKAY